MRLWGISNGSCIVMLSEHKGGVTHGAFSPDGRALVSADVDGMVIARQVFDVLSTDEQDPQLHLRHVSPSLLQ